MMRRTSFFATIAGIVLAGSGAARVTSAAPWGAGAGTEWSAVAHGSTVTAIYGYGSFTSGRASLALGGLHYDDGSLQAAGPLAAVVVPIGATVAARAWWTQYLGENGFRAWRLRGGPEWTLARHATVGLYFAYLENHRDGVLRSGSAELGVPMNAHWTARATGGATQLPGAITATQGTVGLAWSPLASVELSGEAGLARHGAFLGTASPAGAGGGGPSLLPLGLGGGGGGSPQGNPTASPTKSDVEPTVSLGLRIALP